MRRTTAWFGVIVLVAGFYLPGMLRAQGSAGILPQGARLAIVGDSITEQKLYSRYIETYLVACAGRRDMDIFQFGWGGETAPGFAGREVNDLGLFKPTVMTTCYGMNDGGYRPYEEAIGKAYETGMRTVVSNALRVGVKTVVLGSPGAVDSKFFRGGQGAAEYNTNLQQLASIDARLASEYKMPYAEVHAPMMEAMAKAKAALGEDYDVCGRDGVHPGPNGQLIMAYAFLKALGCDGNIGDISVDMKAAATASAGHKVLSAAGGKVELESERYPFCFDADPKASGSTRSILPFLPFNQDLNRFTLKVTHLDAARAKVTWGDESKEFTCEQLAAGVNLAAEFTQSPFDGIFQKLQQAVAHKQAFETTMVKGVASNLRWFAVEAKSDAEAQGAVDLLLRKATARQVEYADAVRSKIVPVRHTITIVGLP
jgi:lysophospholipase L1-like esterase